MNYLKVPGRAPIAVAKSFFTVGSGAGFDLSLPGNEGLAFTLVREGDVDTVLPGNTEVRLNGKTIKNSAPLAVGDRLTWSATSAVFIDDIAAETSASSGLATKYLDILRDLAGDLANERGLRAALEKALAALSETAGAEVGYLVSELDSGSAWQLLASFGSVSSATTRRGLVSNTIVNDAIRKRRPVYLESLVGHPWAREASILSARVFSIACLPLVAGDRVLGCVYLYTQTPGRHIRKEALESLNVLATQAALLLALKSQLQKAERENARLKARQNSLGEEMLFTPRTEGPMADLARRIEKLAPSDLSLLILGETGAGKERVAREVHRRSQRSDGPFVALNCGGIPASLIESILFGHVKGAFTGAERDSTGKIAQADHGTLFLDEIGDLPLELQVKLLRVLQDKRVEPVGSSSATAVDFRVLAATHQGLEAAVRSGKFRQDLYYRLNGATLSVPALRERGPDILALAEYFLARTGDPLSLTEGARKKLLAHSWPGNVRELEQVIARAAALAPNDAISADDIELSTLVNGDEATRENLAGGFEDLGGLKEAQLAFTRTYVQKTLARCEGVRSRAAHELGISERTLYRILSPDGSDTRV